MSRWHITHAEKAARHGTLLSRLQQVCDTPAASAGVRAKPFGQTRAGGAPELLSTRLCPSPFQLP